MPDYTVQAGDCCSSVARQNGLADYHGLYDASENSQLRGQRPNPNQLNVGDLIRVPPRTTPRTGATDATHRFVTDTHPVKLRIRIVDQGDQPLANANCVLRLGAGRPGINVTTDSNGMVQQQVDATLTSGTLQLQFPPPARAGGSTGAASDSGSASSGGSGGTPAYPPAIVASRFVDARDQAFIGPPATNQITWNLQIGALASHSTIEGVQGRLANLGFGRVVVDGRTSDALTAAVRAYQRRYRLTVNGDWTAIKDDLKTRHDQP
ncbi:MAG TPA: peptidoglycan-binding protein [Myxococcales bacterium]|nr:peptidoglycan-binding protein [Myxococcales bacterium]